MFGHQSTIGHHHSTVVVVVVAGVVVVVVVVVVDTIGLSHYLVNGLRM